MFSLPNLPTDNLYKFVSIFGLVLLAAGSIVPPLVTESFHREYSEKLEDTNRIFRELQLELKLNAQGKVVNEKEANRVTGLLIGENNNLGAWLAQRQELHDSMLLKLSWCFWFGMIMLPSGIVLWYWKVQKFQDDILVNEANGKKENAPPKPSRAKK